MPVTIPIPYIGEALGGSVIYEEYKGDFATARRIADEAITQARRAARPAELANALLAGGIARLLQGEIHAALACLEEAAGCAPDPEQRARALNYAQQAMQDGYNLAPGGGTAVQDEPGMMDLLMKFTVEQGPQLTSLPRLHTPGVILEGWLKMACQPGRMARYNGSTGGRSMCLAMAATLAQHRDVQVVEDRDPALLAYLDWQTAVARFAGGEPETARALLDRARALYQEAGDRVGEACCLMQAGDWLAAPLSSPDVLNTWLMAGTTSHSRDWESESAEMMPPDRPERAREWYIQAASLFETARATRGSGALALRASYLETLSSRYDHALETLSSRYDHAIEHAECAQRLFAAVGDQRGAQLARAHRMLACVGAGRLPEDSAEAVAIGMWGRESGSWSYALGLGVLCARSGRRWLVGEGDYERALACFRLGEDLFAALAAPIAQSRCIADQCETYSAVGDLDASAVSAERGLELCMRALPQRPECAAEVWQQLGSFGSQLAGLASQRGDPDSIDRAARKLAQALALRPQLAAAPAEGDQLSIEVAKAQASQLQLEAGSWMIQYQLDVARFIAPVYKGRKALDLGDQQAAERWFAEAHANIAGNCAYAPAMMEAMLAAFARHFNDAARWYRQLMGAPLAAPSLFSGPDPALPGADPPFAVQIQRLVKERQAVTESPCSPAQEHASDEFVEAQIRSSAILQRLKLRGDLQMALEFFARSRAFFDAQAARSWLKALDGPEWWRDSRPPWTMLAYSGLIDEGLGRLGRALVAFDQAIRLYEQQRRTLNAAELKSALAAGSTTQDLFLNTARTALKLREQALKAGDDDAAAAAFEQAFAAVERGKARSLLDLMAGGAAFGPTPVSESQPLRDWRRASAYLTTRRGLLAREQAADTPSPERIEVLKTEIDAAEQELGRVEAALVAADPHVRQAQQLDAEPLTSADVAAALPPDAALLQYAFLGEDMLAWAISSTGVFHVHRAQISFGALPRAISAFCRCCEGGLPPDNSGAELSRLLLEPFTEVLDHYHRLIVIPYGPAHTLPFHALPWQGVPLAERHSLSYLPSASALRYLGQPRRQEVRVLAVGNPTGMTWTSPGERQTQTLRELDGAAVEARFIAGLFPGSTALIGAQATAAAVRAAIAGYPVLHFATHGVLSAEAPLLSSVLLANGEALSVYELMGMHLDADLVVLSACRTAQGETTGGDEVLGLTRGLLAAGARAAIVSLWPVNDLSTSLLMGHFYRRLRAGDPPATALQAAQRYLRGLSEEQTTAEIEALHVTLTSVGADRSLLETVAAKQRSMTQEDPEAEPGYSHPRHWAPFVLVGA